MAAAILRPEPRSAKVRHAQLAPVASPFEARAAVRLFASGAMFGTVLTLAVYFVMTPPSVEPTSGAGSRPPAEASIVAADEPPDEPFVENTSQMLDSTSRRQDLLRPPSIVEETSLTTAPAPKRREEPPAPLAAVKTSPDPVPAPRRRDVPTAVPPPRPSSSGSFVGSLQVNSSPSGARVFINRKPVGVTPLVLRELAAGSYAMRLEAEGHRPWSSAIRVVANQTNDVSTTLDPVSDDGTP